MVTPITGVMQVVLSLNPGGTERLVIELARYATRRFRVAVCCLDDPGAWASELRADGIEVLSLQRKPGFRPGLARAIAQRARAARIDVLHCHHYTPFVYGALARLWAPLRIIYTEHGRLSDSPPSLKRRVVNPLLAPAADEIYTVSADLRRYLIASGFPSSKVGVILNGIRTGPPADANCVASARARIGVEPGEHVVLAIGRLDPVKDLGTLIRAAALVRDRAVRVLFVGDGPDRAALEALARQLRLETRVKFLGHRGDVQAILPGADVVANTSLSEGVSLTLLEAMSAAVPIVATAVGGTPEVVLHGETGWLVQPGDPAAVAAAIDSVIGDPDEARRRAQAGAQRFSALFTFERMADSYLEAYERLAR